MTRSWSRGEKWLFFISGIVCLPLLVGSWIYERQNELPPAPPHVEEIPPANNAYDVLMQAVAVAPPRPSPRYVGAACKASNIDREYTCDGIIGQPPPYTPQYNQAFPAQRKVAYLKSAQKSLWLWSNSISMPLYVPDKSTAHSQFHRVDESLHELAFVQARFCWQRGDNAGALDWLLACHHDICRTTRTFFNGQFRAVEIDQSLLRFQDFSKVFDEMERLMPYLNAVQLRRASLAIGRDRALVPSRVEAAIRAKEKDRLRVYRACASNDFSQLVRPDGEWPQESYWPLRFRWANKKRGIEHIGKQWDWIIAYLQAPSSQGTMNRSPQPLFSDSDPFRWGQAPWWVSGHTPSLEARENVLMTAMALRSFALERRRNARTLGELVPRYLIKVEADPFNAPHFLHYVPYPKTYQQFRYGGPVYRLPLPKGAVSWEARFTSADFPNRAALKGFNTLTTTEQLPFLLYSMGSNGRDDGGMDFNRAAKNPNFIAGETSRGGDDVLARTEWFKVPTFPEFSKTSPYLSTVGAP